MSELSDYFWSPFLDPTRMGLGVALVAALALCVTAAMWSVRVPGEVSPVERAGLATGRRLGRRLLALLLRLMPWALVLGAALLFFPVSPPKTLLLSSRARLAREGDSWGRDWSELVADFGAEARGGLDLGPLVDEACRRLTEAPGSDGDWRADDPAARRRLAEVVRSMVAEMEPAPAADLARPELHRAETRLPRWAVESVELALLKGQMQRCNVKHVVVLAADRPTDIGNAWDGAVEYLKLNSPSRETDFSHFKPLPADDPVRVEEVLEFKRIGDRAEVVCLLSVRPPAKEHRVELSLLFAGRPDTVAASETLPAKEEFRLERRRFDFENVPAGSEPRAVRQESKPPRVLALPQGGAATAPLGQIQVRAPNFPAWKATLDRLTKEAAFGGWQKRMADFGYDLKGISLDDSGGPVVVDALAAPGSVWVYPAAFEKADQRLAAFTSAGPAARRPLRSRRAAAGDAPGVYSWDNLPLADEPAGPSSARGAPAAAERVPLGRELTDGLVLRLGDQPAPAVTRRVEPVNQAAGARTVVLTHFALDPAAQGVLLGPDGSAGANYEPARLTVFWAALFDAARRAPAPAPEEPQERAADHPLPLLDTADLEGLRAGALTLNLLPLLAGLLVFAAFVRLGIANAPPPPDKEPAP